MPKLFSYGTLQQEDVQLATFGRRLTGVSDALVGYRELVQITLAEIRAADLSPCHVQHLRADIDADYGMAE